MTSASRKIRRKSSVRNFVNSTRPNLFFRDNWTCQECGFRPYFPPGLVNQGEMFRHWDTLPRGGKENYLTIDHKKSIFMGGEYTWENFQTLCSYCNSRKSLLTTLIAGFIIKNGYDRSRRT